jgi:hypothetical protein
MSGPTGAAIQVHVVVAPEFDPSGLADLAEWFRSLGLDPQIDPAPQLRTSDLSWLVLASLPLSAFLTALGTRLAEDGYAGLHDLVIRIGRHRRRPDRRSQVVLLEDEDTGTFVELDDAVPEDGYRKLLELDLSENVGMTLHYESVTGRWTAVLERGSGIDKQRPSHASRRSRRRPAAGRRSAPRPDGTAGPAG